ncbi:hypothetical protein M153_220004890 [Pseudoloma neurophilia]|uniref:Uncharacterized protein n=1 Tax=Pseudoloma neurophilia TaxID=146866 RepID=A0A0R0M8E0_9MICR|nr:hypothetical protein M153_220004890 [Pseudoloma neurophilia]
MRGVLSLNDRYGFFELRFFSFLKMKRKIRGILLCMTDRGALSLNDK